MKEFTIGEIARYAGVETSAIRYYESVGLLPPPKRINGRNRRYDAVVFKRLGLIQLLRDAGLGIRELQELFADLSTDDPDTAHWRSMAIQKIEELDELIRRAQVTRTWLTEALERECKGIDECIDVIVDENGDDITVTLSCDVSLKNLSGNRKRESIKLITMQP
jgi:MerR family transcriptional regulator, redox-sensitive transcriptional activator SoxR